MVPMTRREQTALVGLGAVAVVLGAAILVRRTMQEPAPFHPGARAPTMEALYRIDINTAPRGELRLLPGIGPALAARIIENRETTGPFQTVNDLLRVRGVDAELIERIRPLVRTGPAAIKRTK